MFDALFDWGPPAEWDQVGTWEYVFRGVLLKRDIGSFRAGTRVRQIWVNFNTGRFSIDRNVIDTEEYRMAVELRPQP